MQINYFGLADKPLNEGENGTATTVDSYLF